MELTIDQLGEYVGRPYSDLPPGVWVHGAWPVIDRKTMEIVAVSDGDDYPGYVTGDLIDGKIITGDHYVAFLVEGEDA